MFKALYLWMALCLARDEFSWLLRHSENVPQKKAAANKTHGEDFVDRWVNEVELIAGEMLPQMHIIVSW